jgi:signal transduction histidine kinase/ActR/RegA family two-component response regulator
MQGVLPISTSVDRTRPALDWVHCVLSPSASEPPTLDDLLRGLASAFEASAAGLADLAEGRTLLRYPDEARDNDGAWRDQAELSDHIGESSTAFDLPLPGRRLLLTGLGIEGQGPVLWVEAPLTRVWSDGERSALVVAGQVVARTQAGRRWVDHLARRQRMDVVSRLVGRLAHDYGNVLTGILGFTELSLAQPISATSPLATYLKEVHRAAQNGGRLTQQLRTCCHRHPMKTRPCPLSFILSGELARLQQGDDPRPQVRLTLPPDLPALAIDPDQLRLALAALLDNAREASGGAGEIHVSARVVTLLQSDTLNLMGRPCPGPNVEIRIADNGPGLTAETRRSLWSEPFFSTHSHKRGFGLASVYGILCAHHGGVELADGPVAGAVARLLIPVSPDDVPTTSAGVQRTHADKILVVDDDPMVRQVVAVTLERAGYRVQAVGSAEEALASYAAAPPDPFRLVLSDLVMPHMNGAELARRLLGHDANVHVLFMSGQADAVAGFPLPPFELLTKPFPTEGLLRAVRRAISQGSAGRPSLSLLTDESSMCTSR